MTCPKSDEGVKSAVKQGAIVVGFGKAAVPVADQLREILGHRAKKGDDWEGSKVNHLVVVVECVAMTGDCCEAATKFMRQVRGSDGYGVYSDIIGRKVALLALGKMGKVNGAAKVEETLMKRGGCTRLVAKIGRADVAPANLDALPWTREVCEALDATMDAPESPPPPPQAASIPVAPLEPAKVEPPAQVEPSTKAEPVHVQPVDTNVETARGAVIALAAAALLLLTVGAVVRATARR